MSRLIDANANREKFKEIVYRTLNDYTIATKKKFNIIMTAFDNMPTAYDVEKLIERLEEYPHGKYEDEYGKGFSNGINVAIKEVNELADEYGKDINVTTNADKIRGMTDEELAEFLHDTNHYFENGESLVRFGGEIVQDEEINIVDWLKSEVEGVTENE